MSEPLALRLTNARVLDEDGLHDHALALAGGRVVEDAPGAFGEAPEIDLTGYLLLPGIVDLHGDAFERHLAPRPSAPFDMEIGLMSCARDAAAHGVTTAYAAQSWSWEGGARGPDHAEALFAALAALAPHLAVDLRPQVRLETHLVDAGERLLAAVDAHAIDYVVFNDHATQEIAALAAAPDPAARARLAPAQAAVPRVDGYVARMAAALAERGVTTGSHDDGDAATRARYRALGARICEFPTGRDAAAAARAAGDPILMGAPNVVRGGSQNGNVSAADLIGEGLCDALVSDYYYPALAEAPWRLVDSGLMDLPAAWAMVSTRPAAILGLDDRGRLAPGRRGDLVVLDPVARRIEATFAAGRIAHLEGAAAARFLGHRRLAAAAE